MRRSLFVHLPQRARRGAAAAEFALTLPILVVLLLGTIEYGNYFAQLGAVNAVTRDAARFGSNQTTVPTAIIQAENAARQLLVDLGHPCSVADTTCIVQSAVTQEAGLNFIEVSVRVPYDQLTNAIPSGEMSVSLPTQLRARAVYPIVGL